VSAAAVAGQTIVSLTFDDGTADQYQGLPVLNAHNMHATYYLNSPKISGDSLYMTWAQVADLAAAGNEIAGHTAYHADLPFIDPTEAQREICYDRDNLLARGYSPTNFAFPYGDYSPAVKTMVQNCGYNSARTTDVFPEANPSGQIPPPDPYQIQVGTDTTTLTSMENAVTAARNNGGGWVPITFHHICNACSINYVSLADFTTFLDWLQGQGSHGVVVRTMQQVLGGSVQPAVPGPGIPPAPNGTNALRNSSMEQDSNGDTLPDCWTNDDFGNNNFVWTRTTDAHSGSFAEKVDVTNYQDGDNKLLVTPDLGYCTPSVNEGHRYRITEWYKSNAPVYFTLFTRDSQWQYRFWQSSPSFPASSTWTQANYVTDAIPTGINGLQFGLTLGSNGSLTVDDAAFDDAAASGGSDTTPPTVSLTSPSAGATVSGFVPIVATATDNVAVDHVDFLIDGSVAATLTTGPFTYNWNSRTVSNGSHTIAVRAVDTAGNQRTTTAITIFVSNQTASLLQNPSLEQGSSNPPSCWLLGGYGTNTFTWTWTADAHTGTHAENLNITSYTNGDRKLLTNFSSACSPAVVPGHSYTITAWYKSTARPVIFAFSNTTGGNGGYSFLAQSPQFAVASGWTQASWSTPAIPAGVTNISVGMGLTGQAGSVTMDDFSMYDNAPAPDTTAPTSAIACFPGASEDGGCGNSFVNQPVEVDLSADDDPGGSGVARIVYTTDGSNPSATHGTTYTGPFSVAATTTVKFIAIDRAGNVEAPVNSQLIQIDTTPPTATIACNNNPCGSGSFPNTVSITMSAADQGGSGVSQIIYTTDGSTPSLTNGTAYIGAFTVNTNTTIEYVAVDRAGNLGTVGTQVLQVDATPPTSAISCNSAPCDSTPYANGVLVGLSATDNSGGSGVAQIRYTTDGSTPTATTGTLYTAPFTVSTTTTVKYRAFDVAGNAEPVNTQLITVDTTAPSVSVTAPVDGATVSGTVTLSANASDNLAVDHVDFLVDGNVVGTATSSPYSFGWNSATVADGSHIVSARAVDSAGNQTISTTVTVSVSNADTTAPSSTISCNGNPCASSPYAASVSVTLAAVDNVGGSGVAQIRYTTDGSDPTSTNGTSYSAAFTVSTTTTVKYRAYDNAGNAEPVNTQLITVDAAVPSVSVTAPADGATVSGIVALSATVTNLSPDHVDFRVDGTTVGTASSAPYTVNWDSNTVADGPHTLLAEAVSSGSTTDSSSVSFSVNNNQPPPDTTPPISTISCNASSCGSGWFNAAVSITLAATDNAGGSGVAQIRYTTDGSTPTSSHGTVYAGAFTVATSGTTVKYRAFDNAGNAETTNSQLIRLDTVAPSSTIQCNGGTCAASFYTSAITVSLNASDVGGSGVSQIVYTTDGSDPTSTNGTVYSGPFTLNQSATVKYRAFDVAGNAETVRSQALQVDTAAPQTTISCNGAPCGTGYFNAPVSITLAATDNAGGSGVAQIRYTTDGSTPTSSHGTVYAGAFTVATSGTTVKYRAFDNAGNAEATNSQLIQLDTVAPSSTIQCNGTNCSGSFYNAAVSVTLTASDVGGSGVSQIVYTTDGSDPTSTNGTVYSGAFSVGSTTTLKYRAFDVAGNAEPVNSALLQVDTTAPQTTINCAGSPCVSTGWYRSGVSISLVATDADSGVAQIRYTTNGAVPTKTTGTIYSNPFTLAATTTINYRAYDNAGNLEANHAIQIQIDPTPPTVSLTAPSAGATVSGPTTLSATASDNVAVDHVDFLVDGNVVGTATSSPYSFSWNSASVSDGNHTISARAVDSAGNQTTTSTVTVTVTNSNLLQNAGLEAATGGVPNCWNLAGYGTNTFTWTWTTDAHTGSHAENLNITSWTNGDRKMLTAFNGSCSIATSAGHQYTITVWYKSTARPVIFAFSSTTGPTGGYGYLAQSPPQSIASGWTQATWTTPVMPAGTTNLSVGMGLTGGAGSVTMDDFGAFLAH
jgi:peptidoglycan/xylan/chitin deacetylase (PgdA/CDA1 family)